MRIWEVKRRELTVTGLLRRSPPFSRSVRVDAAANVDGDGGEARRWRSSSSRGFARGGRRSERGEWEGWGVPIYKEKMGIDKRENRGEPNNGYLATQTPRFSGSIKDKRSIGRWRHESFFAFSRDDVTTGYKNFYKDKKMDFCLSIEDWQRTKFKVNLGPNVGNITICVSRPGGAGLRKEGSPERSPRQGMKMTVHKELKAHRRLKARCSKPQL